MAAYNAFSKEIVDSLGPQTPVERQLAQTVADNQWRINRIRSIEDGMLAEAYFGDIGDFDAEHADIHSPSPRLEPSKPTPRTSSTSASTSNGCIGPCEKPSASLRSSRLRAANA
jgi:hypothetical protein